MKDIWRRECTEPENAFFLCTLSTAKDPTPVLNKLMIECDSVPPVLLKVYLAHMPKLNSTRKRRFDEDTRRKQLNRMIAQIGAREHSNTPQQHEAGEVDDFFHLIGDALGMNQTQPGQGMAHADSYDSELADLAPLQAVEETAPAPCTTSSSSGIAAAYGTLLGLFGASKRASVSADFVCKLQVDFPAIFSADAMSCDALTALLRRIGVVLHEPMLLAKSIFPPWMARLRSRCRDSPIQVALGFYRAPSVSIHAEFCKSSTTPSFISSGRHRLEEPYSFSGSLPTTMLMLYIVDPSTSLVPGNDILPIANLA
eukprot:2865264-Prymnesium_polylepis.2